MQPHRIFMLTVLLTLPLAAQKPDSVTYSNYDSLLIQTYEPNTVGFEKDADDVGFMEFKLSIKSPIAYPFFRSWHERSDGYTPFLYLAFSGRFGQYIGTRASSPVIAKRFNPKLLLRFKPADLFLEYIDIGYAHESNGQRIDSLNSYTLARLTEERPAYANDLISRGWDYIDISTKLHFTERLFLDYDFEQFIDLNYFLQNGLLQGAQENAHPWETDPERKDRNRVNGIRTVSKFTTSKAFRLANESNIFVRYSAKLAIVLETGYVQPFRYVSTLGELTVDLGIPLMFWYANGYNSDLALYYKRVSSWGVALELL